MPQKNSSSLLSSTLSVTLIILFSKAVGFVREMIMAAYFGADIVTDSYNAAYSLFYLPVLLFSSCITSTLVPQYIRCAQDKGINRANRFASNALTAFSIAGLILSILMFALSDPLVRLVYPGFDPMAHKDAVTFTRIMLPALVFFTAGLVLSSLLNAREKYVAAQLTGLPLSVAEITLAVLLSKKYGIVTQAWGVILAGFLQIIVLVPFLGGLKLRPYLNHKDKYLKKVFLLALPAVLSMAVNELNHMVDRMLASGLNGGDISSMSYAFKLIMFMMGVLVVPLTTVSFSKLSRSSAKSDPESVIPMIRSSISMLLMWVLPIVIIAGIQHIHIIRFAYGRGHFLTDQTRDNVHITGLIFLCYVAGVPFFGLRDLTNRVYHAFEDTKTPMVIATASVVLNILLNLLLRKLMGVYGLALATVFAAMFGVILLFSLLRKHVSGVFDKTFIMDMVRTLLLNLPLALAAFGLDALIAPAFGTFHVFLRLALISVSALAVYGVSIVLLGGKREKAALRQLKGIIKR
ncbi:MAG: murein biosynthesis integral membrane protein MurJ [Clostridiales bacterium]|nr:murein biosynthesis integral membrane protein MurJ [Clostridiales bacterium]